MKKKGMMFVLLAMLTVKAMAQNADANEVKGEATQVAVCDTATDADMKSLQEIVVRGTLPNTRMKGNAMVTRVEGSALENAGTAEDMLVKVPGMTGTPGSPEVLGKGTPIIYINGRLLRDMSELKRLRSTGIREVEVVNNPGVQYDATVRAVVRIHTKKLQGEGLGIDLALSDEQDLRYGFNKPSDKVSLNYRKGGVDVFGSVWYYHQDYRQYSTLEETSYTSKTFRQYGPYTMKWKYDGMVYTAGANWQIADNHSVGVRADLTQFMGGENKVIFDEDVFEDGARVDHLYSEQTIHESKPLAWLTNAYYNGKVGKLGIDLNVDVMNSEANSDRENVEKSQVKDDFVKSATGAESQLYASKLVFSYPLWKGSLEAGTEMSFVRRHNTYSIDKNTIPNTDAEIKENTFATFADYGFYLGTQSRLEAGLRYEHTLLDYEDNSPMASSSVAGGNLHRLTDQLFPSASFSTTLPFFGKQDLQLGLSYSVKTNRPSYFAMNDAVTYISRYSMQAGNSKLKNETMHELTLNAAWKWMTLTASYERDKDAISQWSYLMKNDAGTDDHSVLIKHVNLPRPVDTFSAFLGVTPSAGIWSLNGTVGVQKQNLYLDLSSTPLGSDGQPWEGASEGETKRLHFNKPVFMIQAYNTLRFKYDWQVDVNLVFTSKGHSQNFYNSYNNVRMGLVLTKSFLRDKSLTVRAAVTDVLQRNRNNEYGDFGYYQIQQNNRYSLHKFNLTVFYSFNKTRSKYKGTGAGKEAQQRMNS